MTKHKFTAGPYRPAEAPHGHHRIIRTVSGNDPVCFAVISGYTRQEADANARLLAEAPAMVAVLEDFLECAEDCFWLGIDFDAIRAILARIDGDD